MQQAMQPWNESYCGCCNDCGSCCLSCFCPCIQYGMNIERLENGTEGCCCNCLLYCICMAGCCCLVHGPKRAVLRARYGLQEDPFNDCCSTCCCPALAIAQDWREMVSRGPPPKMTMGSPVIITQDYQQPPQQTTTTTVAQQVYSPQQQPQQQY